MARRDGYYIYTTFLNDEQPKKLYFSTARKAWLWRINLHCLPMSDDIPEREDTDLARRVPVARYHPVHCPEPAA